MLRKLFYIVLIIIVFAGSKCDDDPPEPTVTNIQDTTNVWQIQTTTVAELNNFFWMKYGQEVKIIDTNREILIRLDSVWFGTYNDSLAPIPVVECNYKIISDNYEYQDTIIIRAYNNVAVCDSIPDCGGMNSIFFTIGNDNYCLIGCDVIRLTYSSFDNPYSYYIQNVLIKK